MYRGHGNLFNYLHEEKEFSYCVLVSPQSIELITNNLEPNERFYLIDGTFRITPMCNVFKQVLIVHAQFGIKVSGISVNISLKKKTFILTLVIKVNTIFENVMNVCERVTYSIKCFLLNNRVFHW